MPHRNHTTIEMTPHPGRGERHRPHENPRVHETPVIIPPRHSRSPSPSDHRRHQDPHPLHGNDSSHLTVGNTHQPIGSSNGHHDNSGSHHSSPRRSHSNSPRGSRENIANDNHAPEDSTPLLFRTRREAVEPSDPEHGRAETAVNVASDLAKPKSDLRIDINAATGRNQPLIEPDAKNPKPPLAGPEIDDLDEETDIPNTAEAHPGVDDGFFSPDAGHHYPDDKRDTDDEGHSQHNPEDPLFTPWKEHNGHGGPETDEGDGLAPRDPRLTPRFGSENPFPYAPEFSPGAAPPSITPDVNVYQQKKNLAQGMMDLALLSANANQLRYVLEAGDYHPYYYPSLIFISFSLILQIGVGVGLIVNSTYDIKDRYDICKADRINNFTVIGIFLITVVNVFIASFGVAQLPQPNNSQGPNN